MDKTFNKLRFLDGGQLKLIAVFSMLVDHVNKALLYPILNGGFLQIISDFFYIVGRIAFPIFCYMIVEGFFKTKSRKKYLFYLLLFAVVAEIPYDLFTTCMVFNLEWNNVLFTFALLLVTIWIIDVFKTRFVGGYKFFWHVISFLVVMFACYLSMFFGLDYDYHAILIGYLFYVFYNKPVVAMPFCFLAMYKEPWSLLGFLLILFYNGERGIQSKFFYYWFYPIHLFILGILRMFL